MGQLCVSPSLAAGFEGELCPSRGVGLDRKYERMRRQEDLLQRQLGARAPRHGSGPPTQRSLAAPLSWCGNFHKRAKVSPPGRNFADEYVFTGDILGSGMSGDVLLARPRDADPDSSGEAVEESLVAVKILKKSGLTKQELQRLFTEVDIYITMDHVNIARLIRVFNEPGEVYLVMEYCSGGSLTSHLAANGRLAEQEAAAAVHQALSAIAYCHSRPYGRVVHRDLKLDNFVFCSGSVSGRAASSRTLKLVDFGLSRVLASRQAGNDDGRNQTARLRAGTLEFMAPEVLKGENYNESCDLWSMGIITYALLCGELPFSLDTSSPHEVERAIKQGIVQMDHAAWQGVSDLGKDFVRCLLCKDPSGRPSVEAALRHPWLSTVVGQDVAIQRVHAATVLAKIERFACEHAARRAAAAILVSSQIVLQGEDVRLALALFRMADLDKNGAISKPELARSLHEVLGLPMQRGEWIFEQLDLDGDCEISISEFVAAAVGSRFLRSDDKVRKAFHCFDADKDGKIQSCELANILGKRFCGISTASIFADMDRNGDHEVDFDEFATVVGGSDMSL